MKVSLLLGLRRGPWGGANQFLKALRAGLKNRNALSKGIFDADIILFNSHHCIRRVIAARKLLPNTHFVHRIDGPMSLYRQVNDRRDHWVKLLSDEVADATVFQSEWSRSRNLEIGIGRTGLDRTIHNAADPTYFFRRSQEQHVQAPGSKINLIATSWSVNESKGFFLYQFLDSNLDFKKFSMTFVGRTPIKFRNIRMIPPVASAELGKILRSHDIFITASRQDPCSNSLLEAMACGLPVVALRDGGHPELVRNGGELFREADEVIGKINLVCDRLDDYRCRMPEHEMGGVLDSYMAFFAKIVQSPLLHQKKGTKMSLTKALSRMVSAPR